MTPQDAAGELTRPGEEIGDDDPGPAVVAEAIREARQAAVDAALERVREYAAGLGAGEA